MIPENMAEIRDKKVKFKEAKGKKAQKAYNLRIVEWPMMKESQSCPIPACFLVPPAHFTSQVLKFLSYMGRKRPRTSS